jgi:hypothetical protein
MTCQECAELIISELCGEMDQQEIEHFRKHIEECLGCQKQQSEFRAIFGIVRQLPQREWDERLRIKDLIRSRQRWRTIVFSKAAVLFVALALLITSLSFLRMHWELSANQFSIRWGKQSSRDSDTAQELRQLRTQLASIQRQNSASELRIKQLVDQNNAAQQKQYWQTLEMFAKYIQLQRKADVQKLQKEIASSYDRTGQNLEKTNELLDYVLRASATDTSGQ